MPGYGPQPPMNNWNGGPNSFSNMNNVGNVQMNQQQNNQTNGYPNMLMNQQAVQTVQRPMIPGRLVNSIEDIAAGEVPMDGNPTYFPTADNETIYVLRWTREGRIEPTAYIRQRESTQSIPTANDEGLSMIMARLDEMQREIKKISRTRKRTNYNPNTKKEENVNE